MLEDRGALPRKDGDLLREYWAMHQENFLSSSLREDVEGKGGGWTRKPMKKRVKVGWERWRKNGNGLILTVNEFVPFVCQQKYSSFSFPFLRWGVMGIPWVFLCVCLPRLLLCLWWLFLSRMRMWIVRLFSLTRVVNLLSRRPFLPSEIAKQVWLWSVRLKWILKDRQSKPCQKRSETGPRRKVRVSQPYQNVWEAERRRHKKGRLCDKRRRGLVTSGSTSCGQRDGGGRRDMRPRVWRHSRLETERPCHH